VSTWYPIYAGGGPNRPNVVGDKGAESKENSMPIRVTCPNCETRLVVSAKIDVKTVTCPRCETDIPVPGQNKTNPKAASA